MLYYLVVITSGVDHGYILYIIHMIHVMTKVGLARGVPAVDSRIGGWKDILSRRPSVWIFVAEREGGFRTPRREVGLALVGVRGYFKITCLTRSWYLI